MLYSEKECASSLSRICRVNDKTKVIRTNGREIGLKLIGKLDYLANHCGWTVIWG